MRLLKEIRTLMGSYHVKSGIYHYYRNEFKQAVDFFRKALREDPELTDSDRRTALYYLTMTFMNSAERREQQGDLEAAVRDYERAVEVSPTYPDIRFRLGRALEQLGRTEEAIQQYGKATGERGYLEAQVALAFCLLHADRLQEAQAAFEQALELRLERIRSPFDSGVQQLRDGQPDEAALYFHEALLSEPAKFRDHYRAALEQLKSEDYESALVHIDAGLESNAKFPDLHNYRGIALCELGRVEESAEAFRTAASLHPEFLVPRLNLAFALLRTGKHKEAERELEAILQIDPTNPAAKAKLEELQTGRAPERRRSTARGTTS